MRRALEDDASSVVHVGGPAGVEIGFVHRTAPLDPHADVQGTGRAITTRRFIHRPFGPEAPLWLDHLTLGLVKPGAPRRVRGATSFACANGTPALSTLDGRFRRSSPSGTSSRRPPSCSRSRDEAHLHRGRRAVRVLRLRAAARGGLRGGRARRAADALRPGPCRGGARPPEDQDGHEGLHEDRREDGFRFFGKLGRDVTPAELAARYHAVLYTFGTATGRSSGSRGRTCRGRSRPPTSWLCTTATRTTTPTSTTSTSTARSWWGTGTWRSTWRGCPSSRPRSWRSPTRPTTRSTPSTRRSSARCRSSVVAGPRRRRSRTPSCSSSASSARPT